MALHCCAPAAGVQESATAYAGLQQGPEETRRMQSQPGLTLVAKLLLSSTAVPLPCGPCRKTNHFAWSKVDGGLEDAAVACWGTGGGTRDGWSSTCRSQGLCPGVGGKPVHAWRPSTSMPCCAAGAYSSINKSFGIWLLIYTKVSVLFC